MTQPRDPFSDIKADLLQDGGPAPILAEIEFTLRDTDLVTPSEAVDGSLEILSKRLRDAARLGGMAAQIVAGREASRLDAILRLRRAILTNTPDPEAVARASAALFRGAPYDITRLKNAAEAIHT